MEEPIRGGETKQGGMTNSKRLSLLTVSDESLFWEQLRDRSIWETNSACSERAFVKEMPKGFMGSSQAVQVLSEHCQ